MIWRRKPWNQVGQAGCGEGTWNVCAVSRNEGGAVSKSRSRPGSVRYKLRNQAAKSREQGLKREAEGKPTVGTAAPK